MNKNINPKLSRRIKEVMRDYGLTQCELAAIAGVSQQRISHVATGKGSLQYSQAEMIESKCPAFTADYIMGYVSEQYERYPWSQTTNLT